MRGFSLLFLLVLASSAALGCFGTRLRVGVEPARERALAAYAAGYFIEEKTGVEPEFVETSDPAAELASGRIDLALVSADAAKAEGAARREAGEVPGFGGAGFMIRGDVLEDLRFTTVDRTLALMPAFFSSKEYGEASRSGAEPKKAARKAVNDGT